MDKEFIQIIRSKSPCTLVLTIANILVFVVLSFLGDTQSAAFMEAHGACALPAVQSGEYWRLFAAMFLHFGAVHLIYNMLCLFTLGDLFEKAVGSVRFLVVYLVGGLAGNVVSLLWERHLGVYAVSAGASGAIFAVIGGLLYVVIRKKGRLAHLRLERMLLMVVLMIAQGFFEKGTDNAAHIGGVVGGFILTALLTINFH